MATSRYFIARDADIIAKFLSKVSAHSYRLELYRLGTGEFPRPIGKNAKWPAYEAAGRIERALGVERANSVPGLARVLAAAVEWMNSAEGIAAIGAAA